MGNDGQPELVEKYDPATATRPLAEIVFDALARRPDAPIDPAEFCDWVATSEPDTPSGISRFVVEVWRRRVDLNDSFPGLFLDPATPARLQLWAHHFLVAETGAPQWLRPPAPYGITDVAEPTHCVTPSKLLAGTTLVGYLRAALGLGDAARRMVSLLEQAGERVRAIAYDHIDAPISVSWPNRKDSDTDELDVVVLAVNGAEVHRARRALGAQALDGRYVIGLWFWELEELSADMAAGFDSVDEVWVTSAFTAHAVRRAAPDRVAVHIVPLGADETTLHRDPHARSRFGIDAKAVVVGTVFDHASRIERKNPIGLIEAWQLAFPISDPSARVLFVKSMKGAMFPDAHASVVAAAAGRRDIMVHDVFLPSDERDSLVAEFDVVASLHRSEGYGLTLLGAMHRGTPVIASAYSGNLAFMTPETTWLVPVTQSVLAADAGPYPAGGVWAEPDLGVAASMLREVVDGLDSPGVGARITRARESVRSLMDGTTGALFVRQRLAEIRAQR